MKLIKIKKTYEKNGEIKTTLHFYLKLENGTMIRVEPYKFVRDGKIENSTFKELSLIAYEE